MVGTSRWTMLALVFLCRIGMGLEFQTVASVATDLVREFSFSYAQIGTLIGLFMLPGLVLALPAGYAGRYLADRQIAALGLVALGGGGILAAQADAFFLFGVGRAISGIGLVLSTIYMTKMIADWFSGKELATAMSILVMSWPLGIAAGQVGYVWLADQHGWRLVFWSSGAYCLLASAALLACYREPDRQGPVAAPVESTLSPTEFGLTVLAATAWGLFNAGYVVYLSFGPRLLVTGGLSEATAAAIISIASWLLIFSGTICGRMVDRTRKPDQILYVCLLVATLSLLLLPAVSLAVPLSVMLGLVGMAPAGVIISLSAQATPPQRRAFGMGVFFSGYFLIMTLAPPIAGWLYDREGNPYEPLVLGAAMFAGTAIAYRTFRWFKTIRTGN